MDFETAVRFKLPMVCVVGNDASWDICIPQVQFHGEDKSPATLLAPTRYDKIVEGMGGFGWLVTEPAQLIPALEEAVKSNTVACVNVMIDPGAPAASGIHRLRRLRCLGSRLAHCSHAVLLVDAGAARRCDAATAVRSLCQEHEPAHREREDPRPPDSGDGAVPEGAGADGHTTEGSVAGGGDAVSKVAFSCNAVPEVVEKLHISGRKQVIVAGMETHVCVFQTVRDLLEDGSSSFVARDAVLSRTDENHQVGLELMKEGGAVISSTEAGRHLRSARPGGHTRVQRKLSPLLR